MQFALNEDQVAVRDMALALQRRRSRRMRWRWDEEKHFPVDVMREAATSHGRHLHPGDVGGSAMTQRSTRRLIFEALSDGLSQTTAAFISIHNMRPG